MRPYYRKSLAVLFLTALCFTAGCKKPGGDLTGTPTGEVTASPEVDNPEVQTPGEYETYTEAPELQALTGIGRLPVVEKRIPAKEEILKETEITVGSYGEDAQFAAEVGDELIGELISEGLFRYGADGSVVPNLAKSYTVNADFTKYTIYLRKGVRWSDGVLFTADDCIFYYDKLCLPEATGETLDQCFLVYDENGMPEKASLEKLDTYSFTISFPLSNPNFLQQFLKDGGICFAPEHYYVNLMPEYMGEDAANAKAKDMGYDSVEDMLHSVAVNPWNTPGVPTLNPYCLSEEEELKDTTGEYYEFVRNPYYWKVDAEGKQLPYLDRLGFTRISGQSQKMLLTTEGFLSVGELLIGQRAEATANADRGGYRLVIWSDDSSFAVKKNLKNFPETCPFEEKVRGIGAAHVECWYME